MSALTFTAGQEVFLESGQVVEYVARAHGGHVVTPIYEGGDEEPWFGDPLTVQSVFPVAPKPKLDARTAEAQAALESAQQKLSEARKALHEFEREEAGRKERIGRHGLLQTIDDFLAGRITHVVTASWNGVEIASLAKITEERNEYFRLITLQGRMDYPRRGEQGDLRWVFGKERHEGIPCTSESQAREIAAKLLGEKLKKDASDYSLRQLAHCFKVCGVPFPDDCRRKVDDLNLREASEKVRAQKQQLAAAEAALNALPVHAAPEMV